MFDLVVRGGTVVDGTGAPEVSADVGVRDGRTVGTSALYGKAKTVLDAEDLVATPGFVDPRTCYDAQLLWDPTTLPSNVHGVTTIIGGNCGSPLDPLDPDGADYLRRMMVKVEGVPLEALEKGLDWTWRDFREHLGRVEGSGLGAKAGFLVGQIRRRGPPRPHVRCPVPIRLSRRLPPWAPAAPGRGGGAAHGFGPDRPLRAASPRPDHHGCGGRPRGRGDRA